MTQLPKIIPFGLSVSILLICISAIVLPFQQAHAGAGQDCTSEIPARIISGCTELIKAGRITGVGLPAVFFNRGRGHLRAGNYDLAIEDFGVQLHLGGPDIDAYLLRGSIFYKLGRFDRAIRDYNLGLKLHSRHPVLYAQRADAYVAKLNLDRALADYSRALELAPTRADIWTRRGDLLRQTGAFDRALSDYEKAIALVGDNLVRDWQKRLKVKGHYTGAIDGSYGKNTRAALRACIVKPGC